METLQTAIRIRKLLRHFAKNEFKQRLAELPILESRVDSKLEMLREMEHRIDSRFASLAKSEREMEKVASKISVTIYDLVQAIQIEHGAIGLTHDGKEPR
jgi:hypothetical protein